jgi:hypothetical protein
MTTLEHDQNALSANKSLLRLGDFTRLGWRMQNRKLAPAIESILSEAGKPLETRELADRLATRLLHPDDRSKGSAAIGRRLVERFGKHGRYGEQVGEEFQLFGHTARRWIWSLQKKEAPEGASELPDWLQTS